mgnify:CR=1 FL=1
MLVFQKALRLAQRDRESLEYFSMIDFAVDRYAGVTASGLYPNHPWLWDRVINGYMLAWRRHFLEAQEGKNAWKEFLMRYYFDVLPLHPRPEYLESLTSYLMRLAELNGISSVDGLSALCFSHQDRRITREIADYPPVSFHDLMKAGTWSEEILRQTTFLHLASKFGRSTLPQPVSRFLSGFIGQYLRYCPACFAEQQVRHYLLSWRCLMVTCCLRHKCRLLEACGHCGELIPLLISPFALGRCPRCRRDLKLCAAASGASETELEAATHVHDDIVFLLTPQLWEIDGLSVIKRVGRRLTHLRQMRGLTAVEVAGQIGVTITVVQGIERGDFQGRGATLLCYFKYAHFLCLDLKEVFSDVINAPNHVSATSLPPCPACQQNNRIIRGGYNRSGTQRYECQHCRRSFTVLPKAREVKRLFS